MARDPASVASLLALAEQAWARGDRESATAFFERADGRAEEEGDVAGRVEAVLGLARGQEYNLAPGLLPVRLHAAYAAVAEPASRIRLGAALARCWAYANEPARATPFAEEALRLSEEQHDPELVADALDAALVSHWGPDDLPLRQRWAVRLGDTAAHLTSLDARLTAALWSLTVAWELLDLPRMHRSMHSLEQLAEESARAEFFAASRRLPLELLRGRLDVAPLLVERATRAAARAVVPDAVGVLHGMRGYTALVAGDEATCAAEAPAFEAYAVEFGVATVRAEAAMIWLGAGRPDKVAEMIAVFTPPVLAALPRDSDWLLTLQCVLEGALATRDAEVTAAGLTLLGPYAGRSVVNAGAVMWHGVTDDTLARAYDLLGDAAASARHRAAALATYERIGATWWRDRLHRLLPDTPPPPTRSTRVHLHETPGGLWLVGREGAAVLLPRMRGLEYLHTILVHRDADVPAVRLAGHVVVEQPGLEVVDDESRRMLRGRLSDIEALRRTADTAELRDERAAIVAYLASGTGLAGRDRATGSTAERARVAVRKALVAALARIAENDPSLGRHLRDRVRTGHQCRYETDPDHPVEWVLTALSGDPAMPRE